MEGHVLLGAGDWLEGQEDTDLMPGATTGPGLNPDERCSFRVCTSHLGGHS